MKHILALVLAAAVGVAFADDAIWVARDDPNAGDTAIEGRGGEALPYRTLQAAINAAPAKSTIRVKPGVYDEGETVTTECSDPATNRVHIAKELHLVSTGGAAVTKILGKKTTYATKSGSIGYGQGPDSVRCVYVALAGTNTVIEGFTLADGATTWAGDGGGGLYAATNSIYLVDCVVSNCFATKGGGIRGGTAVRTELNRCGGRGGETSAEAYGADLWNCVIVHDGGGARALYGCTAVNCTAIIASLLTGGAYENCNLYNLLSIGFWYNKSYGSYQKADAAVNCPVVQNCSLVVNGGSVVQCVNPILRDYRLIANMTTVLETGDAQYLESVIALPASIARTDFYGNDLSGLTGSIAAGACQSTVTPPYGGVQTTTSLQTLTVNGIVLPQMGYIYATSWPERWEIKLPSGSGTVVKFSRTDNNMLPLIPTLDGKISIVPPHNANTLNSLYLYTPGKDWTLNKWYEYYVDAENGDDETADGTAEKPYKTLQVGMDALYALAGYQNGVLHVRPGVYDKGGKVAKGVFTRLVVGGFQFCRIVADEGPEKTIIVGSTNGVDNLRCVAGGQHYYLQGFTLVNGRTVSDTEVTDNDFTHHGAAFFNGYIRDCIVSNCVASGYLATSDQVGYAANAARTRFIKNKAKYINPAKTSNANWAFCVFDGNETTGPLVYDSYAPRLFNCTFCNNDTGSSLLTGWATVYPNNCIIDANGGKVGFNVAVSVQAPSILWNYVIAQGSMPPYMFEADPQLLRADQYDYHPAAASPAVGAGEPWLDANVISEAYCYLDADLYGTHFPFTKTGKIHLGAVQSDFLATYTVTDDAMGLAITGGTRGLNVLAKGETATLTISKAATGFERDALGIAVMDLDGVVTTNLFADLPGGVWTHVISDGASSVKVSAIYNPNVYVDAVNGNDANDGLTAATAKKTLMNGLALFSGDVVHLAPGTYDDGYAYDHADSYVRSRVIIPSGVTYRASGARDETIICGAPALSDAADDGCGKDATRCAYMEAGSRIEGVMFASGRAYKSARSGTDESDYYGAAVYAVGKTAVVAGCAATNCMAGSTFHGATIHRTEAWNCARSAGFVYFLSDLYSCYGKANSKGNVATQSYVYNCTFVNGTAEGTSTIGDSTIVYNSLLVGSAKAADHNYFYNCAFATNATYRITISGTTFTDPSKCTDCSFGTVGALNMTDDWHPTADSALLLNLGDNSRLSATEDGLTDPDGAPRVTDYTVDIGCYELDDRAAMKAIAGGRIASVDGHSSNTVVNAAGKILLDGDGATLEMTKRGESGLSTFVSLTGEGVLTVYANGTAIEELASSGLLRTDILEDGARVTFAYAGTGSAAFGRFSAGRGMVLLLR